MLEPTPDILAVLGERKRPGQVLVGFAAETDARRASTRPRSWPAKRVDLMVANDVSAADAGFEVDTNRAVLLVLVRRREETPLLDKTRAGGRHPR